MSPRSLFMASKGRRTPGKPGRFDPTEPLHMTTRHAARNGRPNGTSPTNGSVDENDSRRGSIDDLRPTTSHSLGSQSSSKGRRHSANSTNGTSDANNSFESQSLTGNALKKEISKALSSGLQPSSPTRKRKRSTPTPPHTPNGDDDEMTTLESELMYRDPRDVVEVIPQDDLSDRESDGSADTDEEQYPGVYGLATQSTDATPAASEPGSPASEESQDGIFSAKPADIIMADIDQQAEIEDQDDLDDAEDLVDADGIEDGDELDDDVDDQGRVDYDGKPRRRLAGRRRAEHHDPIIEATLRRQLQLKSAYRVIARALKPVLAEIALKTTEQLDANPVLHEQSIEYQGTDEFPGIQQMLDDALAKRKAQLHAQLKWNKSQLQQTLSGEKEVRTSRCRLQIEDLQQLQVDRLQHDVLTLARRVQVINDNAGYETEDEDADVIPRPKGMGYRFQRSNALDSKYDSRSRLAMESERAVDDLKIRFEMQQMIRDAMSDEEEDNEGATATTGFTVMDNRARDAAVARRECTTKADMLANAAAETERLAAEAERIANIPVIPNKDAVGLQMLGDLASRPSLRASVPLQSHQLPSPLPPPPPPPPAQVPQSRPQPRPRGQPLSPSMRNTMHPPAPQHQPAPHQPALLRPISFERKPHDPPPRNTAFPDVFNNPPPPPLTARPEHIPGQRRRLNELPRRIPESPRRRLDSRVPESPRRLPESPRQAPASPRRPPESPRREPPPFLTPPGMRNRGVVQSLSLMPPTTALPRRRESPPPTQPVRPEQPSSSSAEPRPQSSHQTAHKHHDTGDSDWQGFKQRFDGSPRAPPFVKRSVHEFSGGHLSIERVEPVEPREISQGSRTAVAQDQRQYSKEEPAHNTQPPLMPPQQLDPTSNPGAQDSRHVRERSPPAPLAELIRDSLAKQPRSRASSIISQSTTTEASPDDNSIGEPNQRQAKQKGSKPHTHKANKADRNGMTRKAFKQKNNGPGITIHRFRLGQTDSTPTSTPTVGTWQGTSASHSAHTNDYPQYGYGAPAASHLSPANYTASYGQGFGPPYQHRNSLPQLGPGNHPWPSQPQSPLYAVPAGSQQSGAGVPPPPEHWPPPPGYSGARQAPQTPQAQHSTPGPYNAQYGGPPIAPATPDTRLMQAGTSRTANHLPAFAQKQKHEEANPRRRTQSDVQGHKFQHYEPRRT